ncbi:hypothetical protein [Nocardioides alcanivorans]|uniref:hypothetical protein n=1 Tax=Nocardioides alcanivorans TaxID=2897352 RepID=UPI001F16AA58|nr:hypothetical protein [Nocardioides alcanivorans]
MFDLLATDEGLWVGSDTDRINWQLKGRIARMRPVGRVLATSSGAPLPGTLIGTGLRREAATGALGETGPGPALDGIRAAFSLDGELFHVAADPVLLRSSFDGDTLGPAQAANASDALVPLAQWRDELRRITGLVYDRGRVYYTLTGDNRLWSRGFSPAGGVVGAERVAVDTGGAGAPYASMRGMYLAGDRLHWLTADGTTRSAPWVRHPRWSSPNLAQSVAVAGSKVPTGRGAVQFVLQEGDGAGPWPDASGVSAYTVQQVGSTVSKRRSGRKVAVQAPASVRSGDLLLVHAAGERKPKLAKGSGWRQVQRVNKSGLRVAVWSRTLRAGEKPPKVRVRTPGKGQVRVTLIAYRSPDTTLAALTAKASSSGRARGTKPPRPVARYGSWVVRFVASVGKAKVRWKSTPRSTVRRLAASPGPAVQVVDSNGPVPVGAMKTSKAEVRGASRTVDSAVVIGRR